VDKRKRRRFSFANAHQSKSFNRFGGDSNELTWWRENEKSGKRFTKAAIWDKSARWSNNRVFFHCESVARGDGEDI
jgi:hypothetical protein